MLEAVYIKALATAGSFAAAFVMACIISRAIKRENTSLFVKRFDHGRSLVERLPLSFFVVGLFYTGATKPNLGGGSNRGAFCACSTPRSLFSQSGVLEASRGFSELKAKERANYNAAYRYHCTYLTDYGPNPQPAAHPRLRQGGTNE